MIGSDLESQLDGYLESRETAARIDPALFACFEISGEDAKGWLQGQVTNDLRDVHVGQRVQACLCTPTGQMQAVLHLWNLGDRWIAITDAGTSEALPQRAQSHVVLEDVVVRPFDGPIEIVEGPEASRWAGTIGSLPNLDAADAASGTLLRSDWTGTGGWTLLGCGSVAASLPVVGESALAVARIEAGVPEHGVDWTERCFPAELGQAFESSVMSYRKGCYTGQEVLMRMHSRGHANRRWMGLSSGNPIPLGAKVRHPRKAEAGVVLKSGFSPIFGWIATAMIRSEVAYHGEEVQCVADEGTVAAQLRALPLLRFD